MKTIIEGFNRYIEEERCKRNILEFGHVVHHYTILPNPMMKAYKVFRVEVWYVKGVEKYRVTVVQQCMRSVDGDTDTAERILKTELSKALFSFARSEKMEDIINGEYYSD